MIKEGTQIFACSPADDEAIELAKGFIERQGLRSEDVRLGRIDNSIVVQAKKEIKLLF